MEGADLLLIRLGAMFSFFRPETPPTSKNTIDILSVFSDEDVKFVYETLNREYPPDNHSRQDAPEWLPSRSKSGILKSNELTSLLKQQVSKGDFCQSLKGESLIGYRARKNPCVGAGR